EPVPDDPAAVVSARVVPQLERVALRDALRPQRVVDIVALEPVARSGEEPGTVEVVAARLDDAVDRDAAGRNGAVVTDGRDLRLLQNGIVHVVAALRVGLRIRRHDAVHGLPGLTLLPERPERR